MGIPVTFTVTAGSADLSAHTTATDISGNAGVSATPTKAGDLAVTATAGSLSVTFQRDHPGRGPAAAGHRHTGNSAWRDRSERLQRSAGANHLNRRDHHHLRLQLYGRGRDACHQPGGQRPSVHEYRGRLRDRERNAGSDLRRRLHPNHHRGPRGCARHGPGAGAAQLRHRHRTEEQRAHGDRSIVLARAALPAGQCRWQESGRRGGNSRRMDRHAGQHPRRHTAPG